ncbi:MAG: acyl-CoA dehydrogenase family protein [Bacteroidetes bacterium]|nr:acyl-CoA dehydrogenase family protein [Rhodothermia bacterium]MCS7155105.1 acyl-CoA dehydrogenase family protein [Bacteroidota bacterium]MCX7907211.1 acyl-CoA dehydrogenase family protein [Bacteroidota bacterium]MDW8138718.1 acyl-CoA dehydrogenase family protein [Bacteroidota bacterium]MDW8286053.1 acyl-CoA dehydrogenase family protein [Bacteroidota bacterium]
MPQHLVATRPFTGLDYYQLDALLSEEERMIRDTVREWVSERVVPIIDQCAQQERFPIELVPEMAELGILGANLPEEYGCAGLNSVAYGLIMQELERGDSAIRSFASVQGALVMYPIYRYGSEEQKRYWLPKLARAEVIGCFGLTEPDYGSNPGGMITRARRDGHHWILNGAKMWITNGSIADLAVVWARDDEGEIRGFLVEKGTPGFSAHTMKGKWSLRASVTSELLFEDCRIPLKNQLPYAQGLKAPLSCLTQARYGIAWGAIGAAMDCYDIALRYAQERTQFDRPIASFQLIQEKLVFMLTEITKAQLLAWRLGRMKDEGTMSYTHVSLAKRNNVAMALEVARTARQILGANGIMGEYPIMRHMMNLESVITYEGTHEIHTLILGADITGFPAFK